MNHDPYQLQPTPFRAKAKVAVEHDRTRMRTQVRRVNL
jgi:hypothetical protein